MIESWNSQYLYIYIFWMKSDMEIQEDFEYWLATIMKKRERKNVHLFLTSGIKKGEWL
jgi:hypothetical protein